MEFYILDSSFQKKSLIEHQASSVWTERYSRSGDFLLSFSEKDFEKNKDIVMGAFVSEKDSPHVGMIEDIYWENGTVKVSGPFLEMFLRNRIMKTANATAKYAWKLTTYVEVAMWHVIYFMCTEQGLSLSSPVTSHILKTYDAFSNFDPPLPDSAGEGQEFAIPMGNVYESLVNIAEPNGVGWVFYPIVDENGYELYYNAYRGQDLSDVVILEPNMDVLANVKEANSISNFKTVAHTYAPNINPADYGASPSMAVGYAALPGADTVTDFNRRVIAVSYDDLTVDDYAFEMQKLKDALDQRAKDLLANNNYIKVLDGEIIENPNYIYGVHYKLGDIISLRGLQGAFQQARVVEWIRSEDATGHKFYPTLSVVS